MNEKQVLILGIGNILWADEGFGVRCVETLNQDYVFPDNVNMAVSYTHLTLPTICSV